MRSQRRLASVQSDPIPGVQSLYADHGAALWGYLQRSTGDRHVAEELLQETMIRAMRDPGLMERTADHQRAWLHVVARNLVIDRSRSATQRRESIVDLTDDSTPASREWVDGVLDRWLVADALSSLSTQHREVIVRAYYQDQTVAQIAADLDIPAGTVKSRLHHGVRALSVALRERGVSS